MMSKRADLFTAVALAALLGVCAFLAVREKHTAPSADQSAVMVSRGEAASAATSQPQQNPHPSGLARPATPAYVVAAIIVVIIITILILR